MKNERLARMLVTAGAVAKALVVGAVRLQAVIGLALLYLGAASLWRPAVGMLIVGALLVLAEVRAALSLPGRAP